MLKIFASNREQKLIDAIRQGDLEVLQRLLGKFDSDQLDAPAFENMSAAEVAIRAGQPKALEMILSRGVNADAQSSDNQPLLKLTLTQTDSLPLLTALLRAGADANTDGMLVACFEHCESTRLMVHLSRLLEHGCPVDNDPDLMLRALRGEQLELIHFLINSGLPLEDSDLQQGADQGISEETLAYAKRCAEDRRVRQLLQPF